MCFLKKSPKDFLTIKFFLQFCATKTGRETLRKKGIYTILRELDKSQKSSTEKNNLNLLSNNFSEANWGEFKNEDRTLHALIGILIQYEEEMEIPDGTFSLRELDS